MPTMLPQNARDVGEVIEARLKASSSEAGAQENVTIEWRGEKKTIPVISMPIDLLAYNPETHRIRAQRSFAPDRERLLVSDPYGSQGQGYLHDLLKGDSTDPSKVDSSFTALMDDLKKHGQSDPGIITRAGVLINGNTRRAALKDLGELNIRVGVLPPDAGHDDTQAIELSLQMRKDHKRDYSFMNFLLAIDERTAHHTPAKIISDFRMRPTTFDRSRWIYALVVEAIERSKATFGGGETVSLRLVDFETHQGKLEELYGAYVTLKQRSPDEAESLREQRLLALVLDKSKTDLRLIEPDFVARYMNRSLTSGEIAQVQKIPGTNITVPGPSPQVLALRRLTDSVLQARSIAQVPSAVSTKEYADAKALIQEVDESLGKGLDLAGKQVRVQKRRLAAADRISDACDDLDLAIAAVADARASGNFNVDDIEDSIVQFRNRLLKLATIVTRGIDTKADAIEWLQRVGKIDSSPA